MAVNPNRDRADQVEQLPANQRRIHLPSGLSVVVKLPGILYEQRVFGEFPDLLTYYRKRDEARKDRDPAKRDEGRDQRIEYRCAILQVCCCAVDPEITEERTKEPGKLWVDDLSTTDFWALADGINRFHVESRDREAAAVVPLSKTNAG